MTNPIDYWYQKYLQEKKRADNLQSVSKEMGNRIYFNPHTALYSHERQTEDDIEYICKNIVDEMLEVAEDYAYLAGQDAMMEKLSKLKELADKMYYAAQYLTTDASKLRKAMHDYWHYVVYELKEGKQ